MVAVDPGGNVLGWIAASAVSERCCYAGVIEHSVYVSAEARGRGVGAALLEAFIASTEAGGIWTIQTGIFPENTASLRAAALPGSAPWGRASGSGAIVGAGAMS